MVNGPLRDGPCLINSHYFPISNPSLVRCCPSVSSERRYKVFFANLMEGNMALSAFRHIRSLTRLFGLVVLFVINVVPVVQAQPVQQATPTAMLQPAATAPAPDDLTGADLTNANARQWKHIRKEQQRALRSSNDEAKVQALRNILVLATHHHDDVNLDDLSFDVYDIYRSDENEGVRLMALAALHAIGSEESMQLLRWHVRREKSERVYKLTLAALADYYGHEHEGPCNHMAAFRAAC